MAYTLAWRLRGRLRRATVCVKVGYARLRGTHLPTRNASAKNCARTFFFFYGAAEVDEEELEEPLLDDEGWARRLWVWRFFLVAALRNLEAAWESKCSGSSRRCNTGGTMCFWARCRRTTSFTSPGSGPAPSQLGSPLQKPRLHDLGRRFPSSSNSSVFFSSIVQFWSDVPLASVKTLLVRRIGWTRAALKSAFKQYVRVTKKFGHWKNVLGWGLVSPGSKRWMWNFGPSGSVFTISCAPAL